MMARNIPRTWLVLLVVMVLSWGSALYAGQAEIRGKFKVDGSRLIANNKEVARLTVDTRIINRTGERVSPEQLQHARVMFIETDDRLVALRITILGWQE